MPPNQEEAPYEVSPPESEILPIPFVQSPVDYSSISTVYSDISVPDPGYVVQYETLEIPTQPTLKELVQAATGSENIDEVTKVKLRVIAQNVSLQHLSFHTPVLQELILDGSVVSSLRDLGCALKTLKVLRVNRCGLTSLDGTFGLESLEEIHAGKNTIKDVSPCCHLPNVKVIDVQSNFIRDIGTLTFLTLCTELEHITLEGNADVVEFPKYRQTVKNLLPNLKSLDGSAFTEEECSGCFSDYEQIDDEKDEVPAPPKTSFLPAIVPPASTNRPESSTKNSSYMVSFAPKVLSPRPTSSGDSPGDIQVNRPTLPEIAKTPNSSRLSSASSGASSSYGGKKNQNKI